MANRSPCCIFGICCPPAEQLEALTEEFLALGLTPELAAAAARWAQATFTERQFTLALKARQKKK